MEPKKKLIYESVWITFFIIIEIAYIVLLIFVMSEAIGTKDLTVNGLYFALLITGFIIFAILKIIPDAIESCVYEIKEAYKKIK